MAVGPYSTDPSTIAPGQITATPRSVLRRKAIRIMRTRGVKGGRRR